MKEISREWLKYIDISLIDIYPIQFANCDRLQKNDAVYIFDEVGSGKTISSGLMALDYLYNNSGKVLVITTNALAKKGVNSEYGQFIADWYGKLPFKQLKLTERIDIVNNHYSSLSAKKEYGLVIVDEAQLFLNTESLRYENLSKNIKAEKIVFLTATPIKSSESDLRTYVNLARLVTNKELSYDWIGEISTNNKKPEEIICSTFNVEYPVTRYFKDTIMSLNVEGYKKIQARRLTPQLWQYGKNETKNEVLLRMINEIYDNDVNNRFVVFTRFVDKEAKVIESVLKNAGFILYNNYDSEVKTFKVITGENAYELSDYSRTSNLPTVLILTYQIAEQGVNLPGYNHVVNYHVSAYPSALEQRFGRIDRMGKNGSLFADINMCFLISKDYWDTNTWNFYCAIATYLQTLISYLPSKNTILSEEIIQKYGDAKNYVEAYVEKIRGLLNQTEQIEFIIKYFTILNDEETEDKSKIICGCDSDLFEFIEENRIEFDINQRKENAINKFKKEVEATLVEFCRDFFVEKDFSSEKYRGLVKEVSDQIFYLEDAFTQTIKTVDAIIGCGNNISNQKSFKDYSKYFKEKVKLPIMVINYVGSINAIFEEMFIENNFNSLFPYDGYASIFEEIFKAKGICDEDKKLIISNSDIIVTNLPVFKMFNMYEVALQGMVYTQARGIRIRFDFNPFKLAFCQVCRKIRKDIRHLGLSEKFFNKYFNISDMCEHEKYSCSKKIYEIEYDKDTGIAQVSNWYKLAYHYTRSEAACFMNCSTLCMDKSENFYKQKEELIHFLATYYDKYRKACDICNDKCHEYNSEHKVAMDGVERDFNPNDLSQQMGFYGETKQPEIIREFKEAEKKLDVAIRRRDTERKKHQSLFSYFVFTKNGNYREYSMRFYIQNNWKVDTSDIWTQGIFYEIEGLTCKNCTLDKIAELPNKFHKVSIY